MSKVEEKPRLEMVYHNQLYYHPKADLYYRTLSERPKPADDETRHPKLIELWVPHSICPKPTDQEIADCDVKYIHENMKPFSHLTLYEPLYKLSVEIGETAGFFNVVGGPKRAHACYFCSFAFLIDDWFEDMYRGRLRDQVDIKELVAYIADCCTLWDLAVKTGQIGEHLKFTVIKNQEAESADFWEGQLVFLRETKRPEIMGSDRLYRRWASSIHAFFNCYYPYEIPSVLAALDENRYMTNEEHSNHRWCSSGLPWLNSYQYHEEHKIEFFDDYDMGQVVVSLWGCLTNDVLSYPKEESAWKGLAGKKLVENRCEWQASLCEPFSPIKGIRAIAEETDRQLQICLDIEHLCPPVMKPFMMIGLFGFLNIFPYHLETSRYGWIKVDDFKD